MYFFSLKVLSTIHLIQALSLLGFSEEKQHDIFRLLTGILLLGNVHFAEGDDRAIISVRLFFIYIFSFEIRTQHCLKEF